MSEDLRYPIGKFHFPDSVTDVELTRWIDEIADTPAKLYEAARIVPVDRLDTPYRPGGWTVQQVIHHLADSHLNSYTRFKFAVTEDEPTIKAYDEAIWAELPDARESSIDTSLELIDSLHSRWVYFLRHLGAAELARTFNHPELGSVRVDQNIALYAWHGRHHVAHITALSDREGWN